MNPVFNFQLPKGLVSNGECHDHGSMRLLTAKDELILQELINRDRYLDLIFLLMSQAITKLGSLTKVTPQHLEQLFLPDFVYLQDFFGQVQPQNITTAGES